MSTSDLRGIHVSSRGHLNAVAVIINIPISLLLLLIIQLILFWSFQVCLVLFETALHYVAQDILIVELMVL